MLCRIRIIILKITLEYELVFVNCYLYIFVELAVCVYIDYFFRLCFMFLAYVHYLELQYHLLSKVECV